MAEQPTAGDNGTRTFTFAYKNMAVDDAARSMHETHVVAQEIQRMAQAIESGRRREPIVRP